ncbi:MAG: M14 metallopeptidase family protein [Planctomycetota bacterium]
MLRALVTTLACLVGTATAGAADPPPKLEYYLPADVEYDPEIPTPAEILGHEVGEWHVRHDQLVRYFEVLAEKSNRFSLEDYGRSHEGRRLILATIMHRADDAARVREVRRRHRSIALGEIPPSPDDPAVVWMGYGVHGNESSATNASILLAYHLAAAKGDSIRSLLDSSVILIDPCINPDGLSRFAHWANSHKSKNLVADPANREHHEAWPGGRTNHYWFDLNRDWLLLTHPESRGRIEQFHAWKPNVLTDYHEMGTNSTYFFQPGIPSRQNPLTPMKNLDLTREIAKYHGRALDKIGSLYYTEESFDDFYYGKGSTYPDINGGIGILFEQASSRGHLQDSVNGPVSFPFTVRNQFVTSLSTLDAAREMRGELLEFQGGFFEGARKAAAEQSERALVFGQGDDPARARELVDILRRHDIQVHDLATSIDLDGATFEPGKAFVVPLDQSQYWLIRACFETRTTFQDDAFYDVSAWTLPLAFGLPFGAVERESATAAELIGEPVDPATLSVGRVRLTEEAIAGAFEWHGYFAPRALARLLDADVRARVATKRFTSTVSGGTSSEPATREFDYGTIVVPLGVDPDENRRIRTLLRTIATEDGLEVHGLIGGLTPGGVDLGSPNVRPLELPRPLMVVGRGVSAYESGEVWHLLDTRYDVRLSMVDLDRLGRVDLTDYTHVIMVAGRYGSVSTDARDALKAWVRGGGVLVATKTAIAWAASEILGEKAHANHGHDDHDEEEEGPEVEIPRYVDYEAERAKGLLNGSIFEVVLDTTHPMGYGYTQSRLPVFRNSTRVLEVGENPYGAPVRYTASPLLAGYASKKNVDRIARSAAVRIDRHGSGTVIRMVDNPNFRGVWWGTNKLFANALFFGPVIKNTSRPAEEEAIDSHGHEDCEEDELDY